MYTLDYLNCFIENLDLPEASRASLRENCETLVTTPGAIDELVSAETLLFKDYGIDGAYGAEWEPIVPHMDALSERTGLHRHVVDFLFLALASERLRENYRAAGLTDELFWDTIADLKFKLIECHDVYGIWGTFVASWYPWFYTMHRFKLGRLQYEAVHFSGDTPVTIRKNPQKVVNLYASFTTLWYEAGGTVVGKMAILAEGDARNRDDIIYLEHLPLLHPDGTPIE